MSQPSKKARLDNLELCPNTSQSKDKPPEVTGNKVSPNLSNSQHILTFNKHFLIEYPTNMDKYSAAKSKIFSMGSKLTLEEILSILGQLKSYQFLNLFYFVIEPKDCKFYVPDSAKYKKNIQKLLKALLKFHSIRPLLLQLNSKDENVSKYFYRKEGANDFIEIDQNENFDVQNNFLEFFTTFINGILDISDSYIDHVITMEDSELILRFLRCINKQDEFWVNVVQKCAARGKKSQLMAALDISFENENYVQSNDAQLYLSKTIQISGETENHSILSIAIENGNDEVVEYLLKTCPYLIQQLPYDHQVEISTAALRLAKIEILCDLLEYVDFPFPKNFNIITIKHARLKKIIEDRIKLFKLIENGNHKEIKKLIDCYPNLRIAHNTENVSAVNFAVYQNRIKTYQFLRFHGLRATPGEDFEDSPHFRHMMLNKNVKYALPNEISAVKLLSARSFLHNRSYSRKKQKKYQKQIEKWYEEIYKSRFGPELINVVSQCEKLKIIYDFDSEYVNDIDVYNQSIANGRQFLNKEWILIGAKITENNEHYIRGTIAHELCHFAMLLMFENATKPYLKNSRETYNNFQKIVECYSYLKRIDFMNNSYYVDDKCDNIISTVYNGYTVDLYHQELIVRVPHIHAHFLGNDEKLKDIVELYKELFEFYENEIIPDMRDFKLMDRQSIRKFNKIIGLLPQIRKSQIDLLLPESIPVICYDRILMIMTNVPSILLYNIYMQAFEIHGDIFDSKFIFIDPVRLFNEEIMKNFKEIILKLKYLKVVIDCRSDLPKDLEELIKLIPTKFVFVGINFGLIVKPKQLSESYNMNIHNLEIIYNWDSLTTSSQNKMVRIEVNFQKIWNISLINLICNENFENLNPPSNEPLQHASLLSVGSQVMNDNPSTSKQLLEVSKHPQNLHQFSAIIDDQLLNMLIENKQIAINSNFSKKNLRKISRARNFIKCTSGDKQPTRIDGRRYVRSEDIKILTNMKILNNIRSEEITEKRDSNEISQEQQLIEVRNEKFVIISDVAGTGKSWMLESVANLINEKYPGKWVTIVDLKRFIEEFKSHSCDIDFVSFMTEKILIQNFKFELKIFKNLYEKGRVVVLFDGFDEISPDCAEFVTKLIKSFESNGGNQLWIATRDYFKVNLKKELGIDAIYKLDEFTYEDGSELIAACWVLNDLGQQFSIKSQEDFEVFVRNSQNYQTYKSIAKDLIKNVTVSDFRTIGHPQFYSMIAEIFKGDKTEIGNFSLFKFYSKFANKKYEIWREQKGEIRRQASIQIQHSCMNFMELHEFYAMKNLFKNFTDFCGLSFDEIYWKNEEIVACGFLNGDGTNLFFAHETFQEFFAAKFIIRILRYGTWKTHKEFFKFFIDILTVSKYYVIRMFINDALVDANNLRKFNQKAEEFFKLLGLMLKTNEQIIEVLDERQHKLIDIILKTFEYVDNEKLKSIFASNIKSVTELVDVDTETTEKFHDSFIRNLGSKDLGRLCIECKVLQLIADSKFECDTKLKFINKYKISISSEDFRQALKVKYSGYQSTYQNILDIVVYNFNEKFFNEIFAILQDCLTFDEFKNIIFDEDPNMNILHNSCCNYEKIFEIFWTKIWEFSKSNNCNDAFKKLLIKRIPSNYGDTPIQLMAYIRDPQKHRFLWELLPKIIDDYQELTNLILFGDCDKNNYIHLLIAKRELNIIKFTLNKLREILSDDQYMQTVLSKGHHGRNMLRNISLRSKAFGDESIESYTFYNSHRLIRVYTGSDETILKIFKTIDKKENNLIAVAVSFSTADVFEFLIHHFEEIVDPNVMRSLLNAKDNELNENLLQLAVKLNSSIELHKALWKVIRKYFDASEILSFIEAPHIQGRNLLYLVTRFNKLEVAELTWNEIKKSMDDEKFLEFMLQTGYKGTTLLANSSWIKVLVDEFGEFQEYDCSDDFPYDDFDAIFIRKLKNNKIVNII